MKIMTVLGTRPEIIRLSRIIPLLDASAEHVLVHTGQNYDERLDAVFFRDLAVRAPDLNLGIRGAGFGEQVGRLFTEMEQVFRSHRPERLLVLGDTNSGLCAVIARRLGIPVFHMEAGNRCFDDRVPEEVNRRVIDHASTVLLPYTERSRANLLREGLPGDRILVTGNPIRQVIDHFGTQIAGSAVLEQLQLTERGYVLVTMHRQENVDREDRLRGLVTALERVHAETRLPVICSLHPRTRSRMERFQVDPGRAGIRFLEPLGFFDFIRLERAAACVISDSGTVQEEACLFGVPNVTIREVTERPETVECGSNFLAGTEPDAVVRAVQLVMAQPGGWTPPPEYLASRVAETVTRIVLGYRAPDAAELEWRQGARA